MTTINPRLLQLLACCAITNKDSINMSNNIFTNSKISFNVIRWSHQVKWVINRCQCQIKDYWQSVQVTSVPPTTSCMVVRWAKRQNMILGR